MNILILIFFLLFMRSSNSEYNELSQDGNSLFKFFLISVNNIESKLDLAKKNNATITEIFDDTKETFNLSTTIIDNETFSSFENLNQTTVDFNTTLVDLNETTVVDFGTTSEDLNRTTAVILNTTTFDNNILQQNEYLKNLMHYLIGGLSLTILIILCLIGLVFYEKKKFKLYKLQSHVDQNVILKSFVIYE